MNRWFASFIIIVFVGCVSIVKPAERDPQGTVFLGTPTYDPTVDNPIEDVQKPMIAALLPHVKVGLVAQDDTEGDEWKSKLSDFGVTSSDLANLVIYPIEHTDVWFRDMGGIFVIATDTVSGSSQGYSAHAGDKSLAIIDPVFNGWGYGPVQDQASRDLYAIDDEVASKLGVQAGIPVISSPLVFEGGAVSSNGAGTILYSKLALTQRNPTWSVSAIEAELKRVYGAKKAIGVAYFHPHDGMAFLDGTYVIGGTTYYPSFGVRHEDEIAVFSDAHTILVPQLAQSDVTNVFEQKIHDVTAAVWSSLASQTDQDGHPFTLVAMPDAGLVSRHVTEDDVIWQILADTVTGFPGAGLPEGDVIVPTSYLNFVVSNGTILVPKFARSDRPARLQITDAKAVSVLQSVFPGRTVTQIDVDNLDVDGGGMHCITQEEPSIPSCGT